MLSEHILIVHKDTRVKDNEQNCGYRKSPLWCLFFILGLDKRIIVWYTDSVMRKIIGNILMILGVLFILSVITILVIHSFMFRKDTI